MNPSTMLKNTGRAIAYRPNLARLFGGVIAEIFFEQIFYWQDKADPVLGVYKTQEELEIETGLSRKEQETARKLLREKGVLIETHKRLEHRMYYKIDCEKLDELLATLANDTNEHSRMPESDIREGDKVAFVNTRDYNTRLHTNTPLTPQGENLPAGKSKAKRLAEKIDYQAIADAWNQANENSGSRLPFVEKVNDGRKSTIKKFLGEIKEPTVSCAENYFRAFFNSATPHHFGENDRGWRANFDFAIRPDVVLRVREGAL